MPEFANRQIIESLTKNLNRTWLTTPRRMAVGETRRLPNQKSTQELEQILVDECHDVRKFGKAWRLQNEKSNQELEQILVDKCPEVGKLAKQEAPKPKV
jgi:hypothetical protein